GAGSPRASPCSTPPPPTSTTASSSARAWCSSRAWCCAAPRAWATGRGWAPTACSPTSRWRRRRTSSRTRYAPADACEAVRRMSLLRKPPAVLALEDGAVYYGYAFGASGQNVGEGVFNTSVTGYQESLTAPRPRGRVG